jgi:hypothetical protein
MVSAILAKQRDFFATGATLSGAEKSSTVDMEGIGISQR